MLELGFLAPEQAPLSVLCLGAHSDDIEIGCGGTLLLLKQRYPRLRFHWIVFSAAGRRRLEAEKSAQLFTEGSERVIIIKDYRDGFFPYEGSAMKEFFEALKAEVNPDIVFTHWTGDAHQDHRFIGELTWNTFRNHLILEYEIPKYDGDFGRPALFVPLDTALCERKVEYLFNVFESQQARRWFDRNTFAGLMRLRGMEANSDSGYAEAFHARKLSLGTWEPKS